LSKRGFFCSSPVRANCAGGGAGEAGGTPQGCPLLDRSVIHMPLLVVTLKTFKVKNRARALHLWITLWMPRWHWDLKLPAWVI